MQHGGGGGGIEEKRIYRMASGRHTKTNVDHYISFPIVPTAVIIPREATD